MKTSLRFLAFLVLFPFAIGQAWAQPSAAGDIMFVGYNADGTDGFAFVLLVDTPNGTSIGFTDNEWDGSSFNTGEGEITWTNNTGGTLSAGTVIKLTGTSSGSPSANSGSAAGSINLNASDEGLFAFTGTASSPGTFLSAIFNDAIANTGNTLTSTGMTEGTTATAITGDEDVMVYSSGSTVCSFSVLSGCRTLLATPGNWDTQDGSGDQSQDGTSPDYPDDVPGDFLNTDLTIPGTAGTGNDTQWRMLAVPVAGATRTDLEDDLNLSASTGNALQIWNGSAWVGSIGSTALSSGEGFIVYIFDDITDVITASGRVLDVPGTGVTTNITVSGLDGNDTFALIGNGFAKDLPFANIDLATPGFNASVQHWNGASYDVINSGSISPWKGYFAERTTVGMGGTSITTTTPISGAKSQGSDALVQLGLRLELTDDQGTMLAEDEAARLVFHENATPDWDRYDASKLQPLMAEAYATVGFIGTRGGTEILLAQASYPARFSAALVARLQIDLVGLTGRVTLTWPTWTDIPDDWQIALLDTETGDRIDLRQATHYAFDASATAEKADLAQLAQGAIALSAKSGAARFQIEITPAAATATETTGVPTEFALEANYPNPFNPTTTIRYQVAKAGPVELAIYNVLGQRVRTLVRSEQAAGSYEVAWDGRDAAGSVVASGIYIYRFKADAFVESRSMVLMK